MRRWAVAYAKRAGANISRAAKQLSISDMTLRSWVRAADVGVAFVPVTLVYANTRTARVEPITTALEGALLPS